MTKTYGDYGAGPQEARPLQWQQLAEYEQSLLARIHKHLNEICDNLPTEDQRSTTSSQQPWAELESDPRGRVMVIDGERGSGKTTLFLTLLKQLRDGALKTTDVPREIQVATRVRPLTILDFDPLPEGLSLHAWLVQAWLPLVEYLETHGRGSRHTSRDESAFEPAILREEWDRLFERAVMGWTDVRDSRPMLDRMFDHREQLHNYQVLANDWRRFVNNVFNRLEKTDDRDAALILVPLDDVDLQVRRNLELIHAMRLLRHPRVVYLVTAHLEHTREVLFFDYQRQHRGVAGLATSSAMPPEDGFMKKRCQILADALMEKAFPKTHRFQTAPVRMDLLLSLRDSQLPQLAGKDLQTVFNALKVGDDSLGDWLAKRADTPTGSNEALLQWRGVQRIFDELRHIESDNDKATHVLCRLLAQGDASDSVNVISGRHGAVVDFRLAGNLHVGVAPGWFTGSPNLRITVGTDLTSRFIGPEKRPLDAPSALLARELHEATEDPVTGKQKEGTGRRGLVQADGIVPDIDAVLAWTRWTLAPRNAVFLWPFARYPKIKLLRTWLAEWDTIIDRVRDTRAPDEKLAYAWVWCQLHWCGRAVPPQPSWEDDLENSTWAALFAAAAQAAAKDKDISYWYRRALPLFAAPEFGLPETVQQRILDAVIEYTFDGKATPTGIHKWLKDFDPTRVPGQEGRRGERHQYVMDALYEAWDESVEGEEPTDEEGDRLLDEVSRLYPDAPWHRMATPLAKGRARKS